MSEDNYKLIEHEISKFGKLEVVLHKSSKKFYSLLNEKGVIDHLKKIDQLGFISKSHPGNNHKRWDYVCLQLYLLHRLKHASLRIGLASEFKLGNNFIISNLEILQIAVLFSSIGHLPGTLAFEIALFEILKENKSKKNLFIKKINNDKDWKEYCSKVFNEYDYYKVKNLIGLNFIQNYLKDEKIHKTIKIFFKNALDDDKAELRRLKHIFFRVRQLSFIYLDSFNSDFPFQIDISKILINIFNYTFLFNPNSNDLHSLLNECETNLAKKIYISQKSCELLEVNRRKFKKELLHKLNSKAKSAPNYNDFLLSIIDYNNYDVLNKGYNRSFQFYISKEDIISIDYKEGIKNIQCCISEFKKILRSRLKNKENFNLSFINDQRKELYFLNLFYNNDLREEELIQFLLNYFNIHKKYLNCFIFNKDFEKIYEEIKIDEFNLLTHHYCRKIFLHLMSMLFKFNKRLNAYIKFDNQVYIKQLINSESIYPTGYIEGKSNLISLIDKCLGKSKIYFSNEILNNIGLAKGIVESSKLKGNLNAFYCFFPIELENIKYNITKHYECQNPEEVDGITDIDLCLVLFNKSKFEFYIIEGKNTTKGYESKVKKDFKEKIKPNILYPKIISEIIPFKNKINGKICKGGYIKISNF